MYIFKSGLSCDGFIGKDDDTAKGYINQIDGLCKNYRGTEIKTLKFSKLALFDKTGNRVKYESDYFDRRKRLLAFALRVWLYGEEPDISELSDILWAICDEFTWALPAHLSGITSDEKVSPNTVDLFACETAHALAETLSICGSHLPGLVTRRCKNEVMARVILPFETGDMQKYRFFWEESGSNWAAVCGGSIGMAAIYLIEDNARLDKIVSRAVRSCNRFLDNCKNDGSWEEGVYYWMYAMQYYAAFDELYRGKFGKSMVSDLEKMKKTASLPSKMCFYNNQRITFSDCGEVHLYFGILASLSKRYGVQIPDRAYYTELTDSCARFCGAVRNIAWFDEELLSKKTEYADAFFPDGQWAVLCAKNAIAAIKGGNNGELHNHNDVGSYMYICSGITIADDLGSPSYDRDYFGENRYRSLNARSGGHSLPIINGCEQCAGADFGTDGFIKEENSIMVSLAGAYDDGASLKRFIRRLDMDKQSGSVTIADEFEFREAANTVKERIITKLDAVIDNNFVRIANNGKAVASVEFTGEGIIRIIKDSYVPNNTDIEQAVNIIEFEATLCREGKVSYRLIRA